MVVNVKEVQKLKLPTRPVFHWVLLESSIRREYSFSSLRLASDCVLWRALKQHHTYLRIFEWVSGSCIKSIFLTQPMAANLKVPYGTCSVLCCQYERHKHKCVNRHSKIVPARIVQYPVDVRPPRE